MNSQIELADQALQHDWAVIVTVLILAFLQGYKIYSDNKSNRTDSEERRSAEEGRRKFESRLEGVMNNMELYLKILSDKYTEEVTDIQMPIIVDEFVYHLKSAILVEALHSITRNNVIKERRQIEKKLEHFICNKFREMVINFGRFKWRGVPMSDFVDLDIKDKIVENVLEIILTERITKEAKLSACKQLESTMNQRFDELVNIIKSKTYE